MSSVMLSLSIYAKLIFNYLFSDNLVLLVLFVAVSYCIWKCFELWFSVQYLCNLHQRQVIPLFSFFQDPPDVGAVVFHELPPLLKLVLSTFMILFLSSGVYSLTCSIPRRLLFLHALSFECTTKLGINFLNQFSVYFHI